VLATFTTAAKEELLSSFVPWSADECICAFESQGKKVHQGVAPQNLALHQGIAWSNSTTALGLRGAQLETRVRSRCTGEERDYEITTAVPCHSSSPLIPTNLPQKPLATGITGGRANTASLRSLAEGTR
jgi:hypothetical protein